LSYSHRYIDGSIISDLPGKAVCVGRNYAEHAKELNNPIPTEPLLFMKPASSFVDMADGFEVPQGQGSVHFETEMALLIGEPLSNADLQQAEAAIVGVGLALDLTLRDVQADLKSKGQPWERAKCFDGACPLSAFVHRSQVADLQNVNIRLTVNGEIRQDGNSSDMLNKVVPLVSHISHQFSLQPGDVVLTGTPAGVGPVEPGDQLIVELGELLRIESQAR
jgi:2-keto-4-pentenoate hydratase/2-oxohepta-3-ene-1,7-dioic acid hydratase in catechol pathway